MSNVVPKSLKARASVQTGCSRLNFRDPEGFQPRVRAKAPGVEKMREAQLPRTLKETSHPLCFVGFVLAFHLTKLT